LVFAGSIAKMKHSKSLTAKYLFGKKDIFYKFNREPEKLARDKKCTLIILKSLCKIPLPKFVAGYWS